MAKITVDQDTCIGCGACTAVSDNFVMEGDKAKPKKSDMKEVPADVKEAAEACPVNAINIGE
jgi:ferredoxin